MLIVCQIFTSLLVRSDLCVTFVQPDITAKAAAKAATASFVLRTSSAPERNLSTNSGATLSNDFAASVVDASTISAALGAPTRLNLVP